MAGIFLFYRWLSLFFTLFNQTLPSFLLCFLSLTCYDLDAPGLSKFWIPQPLAIDEIKLVVKRPEVKLITEVVGDRTVGEAIDASTDHAWLVVLGHFAEALGVVRDLSEVQLKQRKGADELPPQTKLIEFL
ncbi:MAG: hypothetical protein HC828_20305, partial [Blastochloris sp.]|nr:hypothetical protein [Blastochloris sp.]